MASVPLGTSLRAPQVQSTRFAGTQTVRRPLQCPLTTSSTDHSIQGDAIAIAWDNASIEIISARTGQVVDRFPGRRHHPPDSKQTAQTPQLTGLYWSCHVVEQRTLHQYPGETLMNASKSVHSSASTLLDTWPLNLQGGHDPEGPANLSSGLNQIPSNITATELPRLLALIDLEEQMPRLSPLPHVNDRHVLDFSSESFTHQATLDSSFVPSSSQTTGPNTVENLSA